jgi:glycosyltransferase involved in cell wall biosynthesis
VSGDDGTRAGNRRRSRVLMLALDPVTDDPRVQEAAWSAANAGWDVTILGTSPSGYRDVARFGHAGVLRISLGSRTSPATPALAGRERVGRLVRRVKRVRRLTLRSARRVAADWLRPKPPLLGAERVVAPAIEQLDPDIVHAYDYATLRLAVRAAEQARQRGRTVRVVFEAREASRPAARRLAVRDRIAGSRQGRMIAQADAVIADSARTAGRLARRYELREPPVVAALPRDAGDVPREAADAGGSAEPAPSVRAAAGVPAGVPLLVHAGAVAPDRGLDVMVDALPQLPGVHVAVVARPGNLFAAGLREAADRLGVADRFHLAPLVAPHQLPAYLSAATAGVIPGVPHPSHELALLVTYWEYMHAGLPIVVADAKEMAEHTRRLGNGEVFVAGDVASFVSAARAVLARRDRYARSYDALGLLDGRSRSYQAKVAGDLYARLLDARPEPRPAGAAAAGRPATSMAIGPANMAGQAWEWARAVRRAFPAMSTEVFTLHRTSPVAFPTDVRIPREQYLSEAWQAEVERHVTESHSHVLLESGLPLFGLRNGSDFSGDAEKLGAAGVQVGLVFHGSDIRDPRRHREMEPDSPFDGSEYVGKLQSKIDRVVPQVKRLGLPCFVSTPDLLDYLPAAEWLPVVVDTEVWTPGPTPLKTSRPVIAHIPSNSLLKGSAKIDQVIAGLADEGRVVYRRLDGLPPEQMPAVLREVDIVVDQLGLGLYGVLACEAMAAGRVVVSHVGERIRERVPEEIPIVEARAGNLREVLLGVVADRDAARETADAGPGFVGRYHDGTLSAKVLGGFLGRAA